ncbi:hypothetical protein KSC_042720 [Ktedonobacter sp. SOSP1-52]|uniref:DUF6220 domain-containing protein n=1 Tax=Ktedonobacter sp. SOSP1-52 TaxID=2778366 RepID=UPI0019153154|nr:DUF6220 domain-containing protein [Ktedonobacter sp. SOSP1-52]GHO65380.1 hypothetical protein KSC_042720 [Ktedonobacter sp. SOSP1-52]
MYKGIRVVYMIDAWLFPAAILVQVFFAGLSLFTRQSYWGAHDPFGHIIGFLPLLLVLLAYLGRLQPPAKRLAWTLLGVYFIQADLLTLLSSTVPLLGALHPVLALVLFALALTIAFQARALVAAGIKTPSPSKSFAMRTPNPTIEERN